MVAADPSASPSHRPGMWRALAAVFPGFEWRLLAHHEAGELVGGAPVILARHGPFRWLHALPWLLPAVPIALPGLHRRVDLATCDRVAALARDAHVVGGEWSCYRPAGEAPDPAALARVPGETRLVTASLLRLDAGLEPLRAAMSRKQRQALEHARSLGLVFAADATALDEAYALHVAQSRHWPGHRPLPIDLARRLLAADDHAAPLARLYTLRSAAGLLSATLALESPQETFVWWSGTHPDARRLHAFAFLLWSIAGRAVAEGRTRMNLGASTGLGEVASFKSALGASTFTYPVRRLDARHAGWAGRAVSSLQARARRRAAAAEDNR